MSETVKKGRISFVSHEKQYATIEYISNGKKSVNIQLGNADASARPHTYRVGDEVSFETKLTPRGDKFNAVNVRFLYNNMLHLLIQKANLENRFSGYLKEVEGELFVKEMTTYLFFPLRVSKWEKRPVEKVVDEVIAFKLLNLDNPAKLAAELFSHAFIPEYLKAKQHMENKKTTEATVTKISPHSITVGLFGDKIQARIPIKEGEVQPEIGEKIEILITYLSPEKIAVQTIV